MVHSTSLSAIIISPDRQRQEFDPDAITDLANSIAAHGLLHPPVMRQEGPNLVLVAGERRLRAIEQIHMLGGSFYCNGEEFPDGSIPYLTLGELDPLAAEEAELDENLKRQDLTWQEQASAIARLHSLRSRQATLVGETHTVADTTRELKPDETAGLSDGQLGAYRNDVRQNIILADHLSNPEVAKAKSAKDAVKILKRQEEAQKNVELAERVGRNFNSSAHTLVHADCVAHLQQMPDHSFDVVLGDPPYGMGADDFGDASGKLSGTEHHYDDSLSSWHTLMDALAPELFRVTKDQAHAYLFCDFDNFHALKLKMEAVGWYVFRTPIVCHKINSGRVPLPEHGPRRTYELCLYAFKGKKPVTGIYPDFVSTKLEENLGHGANKPVELYLDLLRRSVRPGDRVLDPFAGTGTIFPAAHALKCRATGIELSPEYYGIAVQRLNALDDQPAMI